MKGWWHWYMENLCRYLVPLGDEFTIAQIYEKVDLRGVSRPAARQELQQMVSSGKLRRLRKGVYTWVGIP